MSLTNASIKAAQPGDKPLWDEIITGLHLRAFAERKSYYLYFRTRDGRERRPKLGDHGVITLAQAREIAKGMLYEVAKGGDPIAARSVARSSPDVQKLCETYMEKHGNKKKSAKEDARLIKAIIKPKLGKRRVTDVDNDTIADLHESLKKTPIQGNRVLSLLSKMFNLAETKAFGRIRPAGSNPCKGIEKFPEQSRKRFAKPKELQAISALLREKAKDFPVSAAFLYLLMYSGARPSEIANARWEWLDEDVLRLPDSKTGYREIFLPPQAMEVLKTLPRTNGTILGIKSPRTMWDTIREQAGCPDLWMRDFRRTFATVGMSQAGVSLDIIAGLFDHKSTQTTKIYAQLMEGPARIAAAATANRIEALTTASEPEVA